MSSYNKALYNHLRKVFVKDQELQETFMALTDKVDEKSQSEMARLRKLMSVNQQQVKLFEDFKSLMQ